MEADSQNCVYEDIETIVSLILECRKLRSIRYVQPLVRIVCCTYVSIFLVTLFLPYMSSLA